MWGSDSTHFFVFQIGFEYEKVKTVLFLIKCFILTAAFYSIFFQLLLLQPGITKILKRKSHFKVKALFYLAPIKWDT